MARSGGIGCHATTGMCCHKYLLFFSFFALILVAVFWVNRAVVLFDRLIGNGQSALVFLEFTALTLPNLIRMVLPIAAFGASVWVTNRLNSESELTVLRATGTSPWQMARPALVFGIITALMMSALTHYLLPASISQLEVRESEVSRNITAKLLSEGDFLHPARWRHLLHPPDRPGRHIERCLPVGPARPGADGDLYRGTRLSGPG